MLINLLSIASNVFVVIHWTMQCCRHTSMVQTHADQEPLFAVRWQDPLTCLKLLKYMFLVLLVLFSLESVAVSVVVGILHKVLW
jgi:hypothetical protein